MTTQNTMPGFTAEASLYERRTQFNMSTTDLAGADATIVPQAQKAVGSGPGKLNTICQQAAGLIDEAWDEASSSAIRHDVEGFRESLFLVKHITKLATGWGCTIT